MITRLKLRAKGIPYPIVAISGLLLVTCGRASKSESPPQEARDVDSKAEPLLSATPTYPPIVPRGPQTAQEVAKEIGCPEPTAGLPQEPFETIEQVTAFINLLPKPLSVPCFVLWIPRKFELLGTFNTGSAQPAYNRENPRMFLAFKGVYLSVVGGGMGANLVEISQMINAKDTVKGEYHFPITDTIPNSHPFQNILRPGVGNPTSTICFGCHPNEFKLREEAGVPVFASYAVRPSRMFLVDVSYMQVHYNRCRVDSLFSCKLYRAIFHANSPTQHVFPKSFTEDL